MVRSQLEEKQPLEGVLWHRKNEQTSKEFNPVTWRAAILKHVVPEVFPHL